MLTSKQSTHRNRVRLTAIVAVAALGLAACGSDGADAETPTTPAPTTAAPTVAPTTAAPASAAPTTAAPASAAPTTADPTSDGSGGDPGEPIPVEMVEWAVNAPTELSAGSVAFMISNGGDFSHEFAIAKGNNYDELPHLDSGAVDEATLGADFLGRTDVVDAGQSVDASFDLEPGNYVLFCNIAVGPNSHAALGQTLSVTVS